MTDLIEIDGSHLEGGGQILRTATGLAAATGKACRIYHIRRGRSSPGLAAQHLAGVRAVARTCGAELEGDAIDSQELLFRPGRLDPPERFTAEVGTAGSVTLVLQGVTIPLVCSRGATEVSVTGGTHVKWSPRADYFRHVFAWFLGRMGVRAEQMEERPGFYPRGGGRLTVRVQGGGLRGASFTERGEPLGIRVRSIATEDLRRAKVAERQLEGVRSVLEPDEEKAEYVRSPSTGTAVHLTACYEGCRLGASALGERGKPAERVGRQAAERLRREIESGACLDAYMADQILPYMALADGPSAACVSEVTDHCRTNIWVIRQFLPVRFEVDEESGLIRCTP